MYLRFCSVSKFKISTVFDGIIKIGIQFIIWVIVCGLKIIAGQFSLLIPVAGCFNFTTAIKITIHFRYDYDFFIGNTSFPFVWIAWVGKFKIISDKGGTAQSTVFWWFTRITIVVWYC